jgi:hypothetical protein
MKLEAKIVTGPESSKVSKEMAEKQLRSHPAFPKGAAVELEEVEGRWIAAIASVKEGEFPFEPSEEGPSDDKPEPPVSEDGPSEEAPESDDEGSEDHEKSETPGEEKKEHGKDKKGEGGEIEHLVHLVTTLLTALGINPEGAGDSHVPGLDEGPPAPPGGDIPGGPPSGPPVPSEGDGKNHTVHERSLKPGEAPPGSTPIGSPAFASTKIAEDHPWANAIGVKRSFPVEEVIDEDQSLADVKAELDAIAAGTGYEVKQLVEGRNKAGQRTAKALIAR